jgi:hypothetical protein
VAEQSYGDRLRHVADVVDSLDLGDIAPLGVVDHVYEPAKVQLRSEEFARLFAGKCVRARTASGYRHYDILVDGVEFNCCERTEVLQSTMTLPAKAEVTP